MFICYTTVLHSRLHPVIPNHSSRQQALHSVSEEFASLLKIQNGGFTKHKDTKTSCNGSESRDPEAHEWPHQWIGKPTKNRHPQAFQKREHLPLLPQSNRYVLFYLPASPAHNSFSIGYSRIILAIGALYYMPLHPRTCSLLYSISCLLDALDGVAARYFQQSTQFGAVLDMVTDRCTTTCLLVFLSSAWPRWTLLFQGLISLDLASHYMHMFATLTMGGSGQSHKKVDENRSKLLHLYYTNKVS